MTAALELCNLSKRFGGLIATDDVSLTVPAGALHALIGPNGAGKTTLINQVAGELRQDSGAIRLGGVDIGGLPPWRRVHHGLARTFQITQLLGQYTALENVALAVQAQQGHSFRFFADARTNRAVCEPALQLLREVGLEAQASARVADLGQGECKQLELAVALAARPSLLLLDEPMAGLGPLESQEMIALLTRLKGKVTIVLIEHDMDAVFALADRISVLVYGRVVATGDADEIRNNDAVRVAYLGEGDA
ncbi:ABC transporter ATP-binding protein [Bradyrhizobium prioriisuperbiae]|uniref:ABC transporter ATP-binding protein n=1 Tax=Bradyrhizobium prioriisuperbiae TaxID=2854389 RepID=UPI0028E5C3DB|nr:ABC transporter ATP-binding protein [Bradyrhizobium prioritasuperba]